MASKSDLEAVSEGVYRVVWEDIANDPRYPSVLSAIVEGTRQAVSEYLEKHGLPEKEG